MRKNKQDRQVKYRCGLGTKCPNKGITGHYYRDGKWWCSRRCWKKLQRATTNEEKN